MTEKIQTAILIAIVIGCFIGTGYLEAQDIERACAAGLARCE